MLIVRTKMILPPPHGFSRSPVVRVTCSWYASVSPGNFFEEGSCVTITRDQSGRVSLIFDAPYPGWTVISRRLAEMLPAFSDARGSISRCSLVFTDRFLLYPRDDIRSLFSLSRFFPDLTENPLSAKPVVYTGSSSVKETIIEITFRCEKNEHRLIHFDFHLSSVSDSGLPPEWALSWFEAAHAEIHLLFDEMVSDEMISRLA
jgi:uncharacterized protein (TIGR04255 family)